MYILSTCTCTLARQTLLAIVGILNLLFMAKQSMGGGNGGGGDKPAVKKDN